jgi:hypothetical protein
MRLIQKSFVQALAVAAFAVPASTYAEDFRVEVKGEYDSIDFDNFGDDAEVLTATGTFYFKPVPTDGMPVAEAAYITRASYASVVAQSVRVADDDVSAFAAEIGYHIPNTIFFARLGIAEADFPGGDETNVNGTFGIVPIPRLFFGTDFSDDGWDPNLKARYAGQLSNSRWYAASVTLADPDEGNTDLGLEFDYYLDKFSLGAGINTSDLWVLRAEFTLPHGFALRGRIYGDDGSDGVGLTLTWRDL